MSSRKQPKIEGGYIIIPKNTVKCNQYKTLRAQTKAVYSAILTEFVRHNKTNPDNLVKIPHNQIEEISGVSHGSVVRAIRELKDEGFIRTHIAGGLSGDPSTFQLNRRFTDSGNMDAYW